MPYDAHIHLDHYAPAQLDEMLRASFASGVDGVVAVSMGLASCEANRALARRYPGRVLPAYGRHPEQPPLAEDELEALCAWIAALPGDEAFAIGEVGLPYFNRTAAESSGLSFDSAPYFRQLERFAALAAELDRPIVLHAVQEDTEAVIDLLERFGVRKAHFHWWKGSAQAVSRLIAGGYYVSVTPEVRYDEETRALARIYPLERLLVETDGPWPFEGPYAGMRTEPWMVLDSIREIAALRGLDEEDVRAALDANTRSCYAIGGQG
ncbi:TatD family hydrolase [Cohnella candidum]|uniref:TatD family deoxyribonuclease n=1 Tax=Cohnella candidum TaxID=2674991 RepID=A0A3G3JWP4_9BACL|nr:TatD family hydrolase [Cohnella candidum]AYQ71929.1 TatD family deoxyribonuclease [Cohnella candidum]